MPKEKTQDKTQEKPEETPQEEVKEASSEEVVEEVEEKVEEEVKEEVKEAVEEEAETKPQKELSDFRVGDTVRVHYRIHEGDKVRTQPYEGIVISKKGSGASKTFTVRRIGVDNIGVERIFPLHSPNIEKVEIKKHGKVRRAKLYYLRGKKGREAIRIKSRSPKK